MWSYPGSIEEKFRLKIVLVWMITCLVHMSMHVDMVFLTFMDVAVVNFVQGVGGVAEEIPVVGDNYLVEV